MAVGTKSGRAHSPLLWLIVVMTSFVIDRCHSSCNYVEGELLILSKYSLGTFTFAMGRCQGLALKPRGLKLTLDGSIKFELGGAGMKDVYAHLYSDPYCTRPAQQSPSRPNPIKIGTTGSSSTIHLALFGQSIPGGLTVKIKQIQSSSGQSVCGLSMAAAHDCRWGDSDLFVNVSMPTGQCADATVKPPSILGQEMPNNVAKSLRRPFSLRMECCTDGSLKLSNYSGLGCSGSPQSAEVIPSSFNGRCLNVTQGGRRTRRRRRRLVEGGSGWARGSLLMSFVQAKMAGMGGVEDGKSQLSGRRNLQGGGSHPHHGMAAPPNQMIFELRWECASNGRVSCAGSNVKRLTSADLPPSCSGSCRKKSMSWWSKMVRWYRTRSTSGPMGYPVDWRHTSTAGPQTAKKNGGQASSGSSESSSSSGLNGMDVAAIILSCVFFLVLVGAGVYCCVSKRRDAANLNGNFSRRSYAPMMEDEHAAATAVELDQQTSNAVSM